MFSEIYFDNSATTKPSDQVLDYFYEVAKHSYGNPSSLHKKGIEAERLVKSARKQIAELLGTLTQEIIFTSGGSESNNLGIIGYLEANPRKGTHIICSKIEHPSILETFKMLENKGYIVDFLDVNSKGIIDIADLKEKVTKNTSLVAITFVNSELGTVLPMKEIINEIKNKNPETVVLVDGVQAFGKILINPKSLGIDMLSISSHKIHGTKGVGALFVNKGVKIHPIIWGGGQESNFRSGTENVQGVCAFGLAAKLIYEDTRIKYEKTMALNTYITEKILENFEFASINSNDKSIPYILNVAFEGVKAEVLLHSLEIKNIFISTGSACSSRKNVRSHVLTGIGLSPLKVDGSVRISFSAENTMEEAVLFIAGLKEIIPKIRFTRGKK